jgi:beta-mannanase
VPWASIANGSTDPYLVSIAQRFKALRAPVFFVFDSEPEAQVGVRGSAADYVAAWRHVVTLFRAQHVDNVAFVWTTTAYSFLPESHDLALAESLYPGDDVVDWIASDPYNFNKNGQWHSLSDEMGAWYWWARANHPRKPLALTEWGSKEDPNNPQAKADWFAGALSDLRTEYPAIKAVVYFDEQKYERGVVNDWRIDTSSESLHAFITIAQAAWFAPR